MVSLLSELTSETYSKGKGKRVSREPSIAHRKPKSGLTVWFTGLSGAGKTTVCRYVQMELATRDITAEVLDGDVVRKHLCKDLGFSEADRKENIRRIAQVARLLTHHGKVVLVAAISPYRSGREEARANIGEFIEVYVNAPLAVCERRDPKGLYHKARLGMIHGFTGIDDPYEAPLSPDVECFTDVETPRESCDKVMAAVMKVLSR
jgi:adenylylsulfate kinase